MHESRSHESLEHLAWLAQTHPCPRERERYRERILARAGAMVRHLAFDMSPHDPDARDDLVNAGMEGVAEAIAEFDPDRGRSFLRYARKKARWAMATAVSELHPVPRRLRELAQRVLSCHGRLAQQFGRSPTHREIANHMGVSERDAALAVNLLAGPLSLDELGEETAGSTPDASGHAEPAEHLWAWVRSMLDERAAFVVFQWAGGVPHRQIAASRDDVRSDGHSRKILHDSLKGLSKAAENDALLREALGLDSDGLSEGFAVEDRSEDGERRSAHAE